jgi:hypothetical protein
MQLYQDFHNVSVSKTYVMTNYNVGEFCTYVTH